MGDHPRACGENKAGILQSVDGAGSPPRVRGKLAALRRSDAGERITPARAGKTHAAVHAAGKTADHPRACGEN